MRHRAFVFACALLLPLVGYAQEAKEEEEPEFPDFAETVKEWEHQTGFLHIYRDPEDAGHMFAAIPTELMDTPFFLATSVAGGSDYAGWQWEDKLVHFKVSP